MDKERVFKLKKLIKELDAIRGRHTELVSVYVPAGYNLTDIINQLKDEQGTASNIKSKTTRKNVLAALERIIQHLRVFKRTPANGLVVFCGNVSPVEGKEDIRLWSFEPPMRLKTKLYWCDQVFVLDPLKEVVEEKEVYGLIVLDAKDANIGLLVGKTIQPLKHMESRVPAKTVKGGMCLAPDTLLQLHNGRIIEISRIGKEDNPILSSDLHEYKTVFALHNDIMKRSVTEAIRIHTKSPSFEIVTTPEHRFFIPSSEGIEIKYCDELKEGDDILIAKRIETSSVLPRFNSKFLNHRGKAELLLYQILGYMMGDGVKDGNRIVLFDKDEDIINKYRRIAKMLFRVNIRKRFRRDKGYFELKIYCKELMEVINNTFFGIFEKKRSIHPIIQRLPLQHLARFISGLFDAEGYVDATGLIGITMSSKTVIRMLQLLLLRFGILSSYREELYKGKYNKYHLRITEYDSLKSFEENIGFLSKRKKEALKKIIRVHRTWRISQRRKISFTTGKGKVSVYSKRRS